MGEFKEPELRGRKAVVPEVKKPEVVPQKKEMAFIYEVKVGDRTFEIALKSSLGRNDEERIQKLKKLATEEGGMAKLMRCTGGTKGELAAAVFDSSIEITPKGQHSI